MPTKRITGNDAYGRPQWLRELRNHNMAKSRYAPPHESKRNNKPMPKTNYEGNRKILAALDRQNAEFDTLAKLSEAYECLPPVVDDDYPRYRHHYESALKTFIAALETNGRLPVSMITAVQSIKLDVQAIAKIIGTSPSPLDTAEDKPCDRGCEQPGGGTCICAELNSEAATRVVAYLKKQLATSKEAK